MMAKNFSRRTVLGGAGSLALGAAFHPLVHVNDPVQVSAEAEGLNELVIALPGEPESIDPALAYSARDWSIVHSIYDSPLMFSADGEIVPLAAESWEMTDETILRMTLRSGLLFHDGSPVTSAAITRGVEHIQNSSSLAVDLFRNITDVGEIDERTVEIQLDAPTPWLPAQIAVWLALLPEEADADTVVAAPVGSGPYRFDDYERGNRITMTRNPDYAWSSPKGEPLAEQVVYRFVPDPATRIADISTGAVHIAVDVPIDFITAVEEPGAILRDDPTIGSSFVRIATDVEPFDDPRVGQALNHAVNVQEIAEAFVSSDSQRLASLFPDERALGFDSTLDAFDHDPDRARQLLDEAGLADGFETTIDVTTAARTDVVEAIVAQWAEVGVEVTIQTLEYAEFNATWGDNSAAPLRLTTWSPLFDPHTLLDLVFSAEGFLSRYENAEAHELIAAAAVETDPEERGGLYRELGGVMQQDPAAIYLWNLTSTYAVADVASEWSSRADEYVLPLASEETME